MKQAVASQQLWRFGKVTPAMLGQLDFYVGARNFLKLLQCADYLREICGPRRIVRMPARYVLKSVQVPLRVTCRPLKPWGDRPHHGVYCSFPLLSPCPRVIGLTAFDEYDVITSADDNGYFRVETIGYVPNDIKRANLCLD